MQSREKYLAGAFIAAILIWQIGGWMLSALTGPFQTASDKIDTLRKSVATKRDGNLALLKATKSLKEWKAASLPPDQAKAKQPTAVNAQRLYLEWLTDLGELCGFDELKVSAGTTNTKGKIYISVIVKLEADARYEQLVQFLDLFYRVELLHRVTSLRVSTKVFEGDPQLKVSLEAEGLALLDVAPRRTLFPESILVTPLAEDGTFLQIANDKDFPKEPGYLIKIKNELLKVVSKDGETLQVERGLERTMIGFHVEGTPVEVVQMKSNQSRSLAEVRELLSHNIFVKPSPNYKMKVGPIGEKTFSIGKPIEFVIQASGYDSLLGKPEFKLTGTVPEGLRLDRYGKLSWKTTTGIQPGKYPITFEVRHPSASDGVLNETLTIRLRDSISAPKLADPKPPKVFLNRQWTYVPKLVLPDTTTPTKLSWKLGDRPPKGITIDAKSGELKWLPGDEVPLGEITVPVVISDGDTPPQTTTISLKLSVEDDAAQFTRLTGVFAIGGKKRAFLTDQSTAKKTELTEGEDFSISEISGKIKTINGKYVLMLLGQKEVRWDVGESLREAEERAKY